MHNISKMTLLSCITFLSLSSGLFAAAEIDEHTPNPTDIQVVSVDPTPQPDDVELKMVFPANGELKADWPIHFEARLDGYPVGVDSQFDRAKEIYVEPEGQSVHVIVDDKDYFEAYEALFDALDDHDLYYDQKIDFDLPFKLSPGKHVLRIFPCRSFGESLKGPGCYDAITFYYKKKEDNFKVDLDAPYLTYNEPQGTFPANKPVLLDFYIQNCVMSKDGYKVRVTIDGKVQRTLSLWGPYYIYGLKKGKHTIKLELLNPRNAVIPGIFNTVEKMIVLK